MKSGRDRTTAFAKAVVAGRIVAGELAIWACRRHLADLETGPARGLEWSAIEAEAMIDAYPAYFSITDGPNAGQPFELLDWMVFCTGSLFGWYQTDDDGRRRLRFDMAWVETAKGQGKSPWMATTALLCTGSLGRTRAQVYALAPKEEQARVMFADAAAAIRSQLPGEDEGVTLETQGVFIVRGMGDNAHKIEHPRTKSVFKTVSGGSTRISGPRPDFVFGDEIHEVVDRALIDMWQASLAKNAAGGILVLATNTPAMTQYVGTYYSEMAQRVVQGLDVNDQLFVWITRVDIVDRPTALDTPAVWPKAMPALGKTFGVENIRREVAKAKLNPSEAARVNRLYMGIPTGAVDFWLDDPALWDRAVQKVDPEQLIGLKSWLALDLSMKHDLTALTQIWERLDDDGRRTLISRETYWTCSANLEKRARQDRLPYVSWAADGHINVIEGDAITKDFIAVEVAQICDVHNVDFLAYDVANLIYFEEACERVGFATWRWQGADKKQGIGLKMMPHGQGTRRNFTADKQQLSMPASIEALEDALRLGTAIIDDSPVSYACAANAAVVTDAVMNRSFDKKKSRGRIDGLVTKAMAHGAATMQLPPPKRSVYEDRGIIRL
jgi:phage terminase large subunit-like protein